VRQPAAGETMGRWLIVGALALGAGMSQAAAAGLSGP
jgi:hypothetical protein